MSTSNSNNSRKSPTHNENVNALTAALESARVGENEEAVTHEPPKRVPRFSRHRHGALKEPSGRKKKFTLANPTFKVLSLYPVPVQYRRFPRTSLVKTKHKTAKLHALNIKRRIGILGLKKRTQRKPLQKITRSVRKSRRTGK